MRALVVLLFLLSCGPMEFSPWDSTPPNTDLTEKHLLRLGKGGAFKPFTVAILGDPQARPAAFRDTRDVVNMRTDVSFSLVAGDITDRGMAREYKFVNEVLSGFIKPVLTVVGNHDGLNNGSALYQKMFGSLDYTFIYNEVTFVMWNDNGYEWDVSMEWLDNAIKSAPGKVVVVSHQSPYSGALTSEQEVIWERIRKSPKLIGSVHGHYHHFEFHKENGLPIYIVDRVEESHHGLMRIEKDRVEFFNCSVECVKVEDRK
jgi:Icc protein